ncbi:hypothetical protein AX15_002998 [Amanita polypyramis BW_CC]|nr:hypothetical protein AX15_002998 [Amanita polypyramis BW_CC]
MALILAVNAGSSSLKISLFNRQADARIVEEVLNASISSIQSTPTTFKFSGRDFATINENADSISDHSSAFAYFLHAVTKNTGIDLTQTRYICHRVVHGGDYAAPVKIDRESFSHIEQLSNLAPLHNGAALSVIRACIEQMPDAVSIAYFDTTFHRTIPPHIYSYAINQDIATKRGLRKYGFHGLSYAYILREVSRFLNKAPQTLNLVIMHLGAGASVCAVRQGTSLDTSMGLTPLTGLPGATRSGEVDPSLIFHYTNNAGMISHDPNLTVHVGVTQAEEILNRKAGWKSITNSANFKDIVQHADVNHPPTLSQNDNEYNLAFHLFVDRVLDFIGSYHLKLGGDVDAVVFAGGVGEHSQELREAIGKAIECFHYQAIDPESNLRVQSEKRSVSDIGAGGTDKGRVLVCKTDEQFEMARECGLDEKLW